MCLSPPAGALKTGNMALAVVPYGDGTSVGSNYDFNDKQIGLKPKKEGTYFIYTELNFTCTFKCSAGVLSVSVSDKLTCEVELPKILANGTNVSKRCWTVAQINEELLLTQMRLPETGLKDWSLNLKGSGIGMFLVDWWGHYCAPFVLTVLIFELWAVLRRKTWVCDSTKPGRRMSSVSCAVLRVNAKCFADQVHKEEAKLHLL